MRIAGCIAPVTNDDIDGSPAVKEDTHRHTVTQEREFKRVAEFRDRERERRIWWWWDR